MKRIILCFMFLFLIAASPDKFTEEEIVQATLELHKSKNGRHYLWHECGKRLNNGKREKRAAEYGRAIMESVDAVEMKTGEWIDPRYVKAILYRESSDNECAIGKQEIGWLAEQLGKTPNKNELVNHIKRWVVAKKEARKWCRARKFASNCSSDYMRKHYPEYRYIMKGWDVGAAQFRYPSSNVNKRKVVLPDGEVVDKVALKDFFDYRISIQMLVEDLAVHKHICKDHKHVVRNKRGVIIRRLNTEDAYYVHHHTGSYRWSEKYWKRVRRHLNVIDKVKAIAVAHLFSRFYWNNSFFI